jgi:hypothetical protein
MVAIAPRASTVLQYVLQVGSAKCAKRRPGVYWVAREPFRQLRKTSCIRLFVSRTVCHADQPQTSAHADAFFPQGGAPGANQILQVKSRYYADITTDFAPEPVAAGRFVITTPRISRDLSIAECTDFYKVIPDPNSRLALPNPGTRRLPTAESPKYSLYWGQWSSFSGQC